MSQTPGYPDNLSCILEVEIRFYDDSPAVDVCPNSSRRLMLDGSRKSLVAVGCADASSKVWLYDVSDGEPKHLIDSYSDTWAVAFSSDGEMLATGHENGTVKLWSTAELPSLRWLAVQK